jgi:competence protein ComEC
MAAVIALVLLVRAHPRSLTVTFLAIGQGDAALVEWPDGRTWLIDGGPPGDALLRWLRRRGVRSLDALVLSHPHPDHLGGLLPVVGALPVREVRAPRPPRAGERDYATLLARARAPAGARAPLRAGTLPPAPRGVALLHPLPAFLDAPSRKDRVNDESLVLRLSHAGRSVLFPGDVEREGEAALVDGAAARPLRADVLKVPHHGSRTSSHAAFLAAVAPRWAVVSCGFANRYGHPHAVTLGALAGVGARVLRTDEVGSVVVRLTDAGSVEVGTEGPPAEGWGP